jgi:hypothetical protein
MAFDLNSLTAYVDENKLPLIKSAVLGGRTLQYVGNIVPDVKSSVTINIINSELVAAATDCGWSVDGTTTDLTQIDLSTCPIQITEELCINDLEQYYVQKMMSPGSYNETIPFEEIYVSEKVDKINAMNDDILWRGNVASGSGNLALCDGYIQRCEVVYSGSVVDGNTTNATGITASNIVGLVDDMNSAIPFNIIDRDDLILFVGYDVFRTYATALRNLNLFAYDGREDQIGKFEMLIPGSTTKIVAVRGLNNTNKMLLTSASNLYFSTDLMNDAEDFSLWYSRDNDTVRMKSKYRMGTGFAFPEFVVFFKLN